MAVYHLRTFRLGQQTYWGVAVPRSTILQGVTDGSVTLDVDDEVVEAIGWNVGNLVVPKYRNVTGTWTQIATYEQILYVLHGLFGPVTPAGSSAPYTWTYAVPRANVATPQIYTIEYAFDVGSDGAYVIHDCLISSVTMRGEVNKAVELEVEFISHAFIAIVDLPSDLLPPPGLSIVRVYECNVLLAPVTTIPNYQDHLFAATLISFEVTVRPNRHIKRFIGGAGGAPTYGDGQWEIEGTLTLEVNGQVRPVLEQLLGGGPVQRFLRLEFISTDDPNKQLFIDIPFLVRDSIELFRDRDGNTTVEIGFVGLYADVIDTALRVTVRNNMNTLP